MGGDVLLSRGLGTNEKIGLAACSLGSDEYGQPPLEREVSVG